MSVLLSNSTSLCSLFQYSHTFLPYALSFCQNPNLSRSQDKMLFNTPVVSLSLLAAVAVAAPELAPYKMGSMSKNPALMGLAKRQAGYQPTQHNCGFGATCAEACGTDYITCPSSDIILHCFDPVIKETCCPDGTGSKSSLSLRSPALINSHS
jgi:hypothetical protein